MSWHGWMLCFCNPCSQVMILSMNQHHQHSSAIFAVIHRKSWAGALWNSAKAQEIAPGLAWKIMLRPAMWWKHPAVKKSKVLTLIKSSRHVLGPHVGFCKSCMKDLPHKIEDTWAAVLSLTSSWTIRPKIPESTENPSNEFVQIWGMRFLLNQTTKPQTTKPPPTTLPPLCSGAMPRSMAPQHKFRKQLGKGRKRKKRWSVDLVQVQLRNCRSEWQLSLESMER